ncbi:hypothetical protein RCL1_008284 [Eukaryota sp. TZLM3-RCL]
MDSRIKNSKERINDYLQRFVTIKARAMNLRLHERIFMMRFASGVVPKRLSDSLALRITDGIILSFQDLISITFEEVALISRVSSWTRPSEPAEVDSKSKNSEDPKKLKCYKCHEFGHIASHCPKKIKTEHIRFLSHQDQFLKPLDFTSQ